LGELVFPPRDLVTVAVDGKDKRFPVNRIFCVGQNYAAHAREMGGDPARTPPFFFSKFPDAIAPNGAVIPYPPLTANFHHEVELVVALSGEGFAVSAAEADGLIFGYAVGLDMTRRDLQAAAKKQGQPWDFAKNFPYSAPIGVIREKAVAGTPGNAAITLTVNGDTRQNSTTADMIRSVPEIIVELSKAYHLYPGDLIYTGTPEGVGAVARGDVLHATVAGLPALSVTIG